MQHERRETIDFRSTNIIRLPERRDYIGEDIDPVTEYYRKRDANRKFFRLRSEEKVDLSRFDRTNYMTTPSPLVGVTKQKNYLTDKRVADFIEAAEQTGDGKRYIFDETMRKGSSTTRDAKEKLKRDTTIEQFKIMKRIISNEKKAQDLLKNRISSMEAQNKAAKETYTSMLA